MEAIVAILTILAGLTPLIVWLVRRNASPEHQNQDRYERIENDIATGDDLTVSEHGAADLDELDRVQRGKGDRK